MIIGICIICIGMASFVSGRNFDWLAVTPEAWGSFDGLMNQIVRDWPRYLSQFITLLAMFGFAARMMRQDVIGFVRGFVLIYALSLGTLMAGAWTWFQRYNIEPALIALALGTAITHIFRLPSRVSEAFRVEFYIKTGIVLLGTTLPITLIVWAGPTAMVQASIVSVVTFTVIYATAKFLELDRQLAVLLGVGGAVCGVSAVIAIAGAIRARRDHLSVAVGSVVSWSIMMIFFLPLLARAWYLPAGVGGAWIGTSEFTDAAGFAAAQTYAAFARSGSIEGTPDQVLLAYTLLKVVGRDVWIGLWAVILSFWALTRWEAPEVQRRVSAMDLWHRFPKFILGLLIASMLTTFVSQGLSYAEFDAEIRPGLIMPLASLRGWVFTFSFLSIGLTTRLRGFLPASGSAFIAFATGVMVNVVLGYILSAIVFQSYWSNLTR